MDGKSERNDLRKYLDVLRCATCGVVVGAVAMVSVSIARPVEMHVNLEARDHQHTHEENRPMRVIVVNQRPATPGTTSSLDADAVTTQYFVVL